MSDWNRGREEDQHRHRTDDRRDWGERDRRLERERREQRSFGDHGRYESRRDDSYPGVPSGYGDYGSPRRAGETYGSQDYRSERYGAYGGRSYASPGYGEPGYAEGYAQRRGHSYGARQAYGEDPRRWERDRSDFIGHNEPVQQVTEGEADRGMWANMGRGDHRGRGPRNYTRSDERVREDVNDRLSDDAWLDATEIEVQVSACEVTLTGTVQSREDRRRAEDLAEQVSGVKHVQNNLRVETQPSGRTAGATASSSPSGGGQTASGQARGAGSQLS